MTTEEKVRKLITIVDQQDKIKLTILNNAVIKCIKDYQTESSSARLTDWQRAESALEACVTELWSKHYTDDASLPNALAVVDHLSAKGWKVKKSSIYNHRKEGKLRPQPDGSFKLADVDRYAETYLRRKDGGQSDKLDKLQQQRLDAEIRKTRAQADHWEMKAKSFSGAYVPKDLFEKEMAKRLAVFRNDLETFASSEAGEIATAVAGDPGRIPDLIAHLMDRFEVFLARYAEEREFKVPLPPTDPGEDPDDKEEDHDD